MFQVQAVTEVYGQVVHSVPGRSFKTSFKSGADERVANLCERGNGFASHCQVTIVRGLDQSIAQTQSEIVGRLRQAEAQVLDEEGAYPFSFIRTLQESQYPGFEWFVLRTPQEIHRLVVATWR